MPAEAKESFLESREKRMQRIQRETNHEWDFSRVVQTEEEYQRIIDNVSRISIAAERRIWLEEQEKLESAKK